MAVRVIPRLDIKGPNLVKGIHLEGLRVLGKPEDFARHYYHGGADELIYMDVVASLYGRNSLIEIIERTAREVFIPLLVGGGLRTLDDINRVLRAGADKVSLNTAAINRPELISEAVQRFGSSTIVVSVEAKHRPDGSYEAYTDNGRERTGVDAIAWAIRAAELGAGEIMLTSIEQEGTGRGFDLDLTRRVSTAVDVPVIASGGAGTVEHVRDVITRGRADAVAIASVLHYGALDRGELDAGSFAGEGNIEYLQSGLGNTRIRPATLGAIKGFLLENGIDCRPALDGFAHV
jgi:cyclase